MSNFTDFALQQDVMSFKEKLESAIADKVGDALAQKKLEVAQTFFDVPETETAEVAEEVEQIDEEGGISHIVAKNKLQDHKDAMESEGYDTVTKSLPKDHPKAKTHIGIVAQSPVEHDYHSSMGHAEPMHEEVESVPTQRSNFIGKHHLKRDHSDELGSRYVFSTDPAKMKKSYSTEKGQKNAANRNVANLKATIKSSLGKHSKPNLPEEVEQTNEKALNPYAVGMAQAMKSTGDKPPLKKATIKKAHEIAKSVAKK